MAKRRSKGGRVTPKGTRPEGFRPKRHNGAGSWDEPEADLMDDVRRTLDEDHPVGLLALASSLLAVVDPQWASPLARAGRRPAGPSKDELVGTFIKVDRRETTGLLAAMAALSTDQIERRRITRIVERRPHQVPRWLTAMGAAEAYQAAVMAHMLGDGDNVIVGVRFPTGHELTAVVYIDHNLGTLVKDAFVVPGPIADLIAMMRAEGEDPDTTFADVHLADARVRIDDAAALSAITIPPLETDTWPVCRPLVAWMTGLLPAGGKGYERPEWSDADRRDLADRFLSSSFGAGLDDEEISRGLVDDILWFGCDYGPGDPLRWSPVAIEILLTDWIPRKIVADVDYLAKAPHVLRAFTRFCHAERSIPTHLTAETLDAIDRWAPDYQAAIRSPRPQGPAALLAKLEAFEADRQWDEPNEDDDDPFADLVHEDMVRQAADVPAMARLRDVVAFVGGGRPSTQAGNLKAADALELAAQIAPDWTPPGPVRSMDDVPRVARAFRWAAAADFLARRGTKVVPGPRAADLQGDPLSAWLSATMARLQHGVVDGWNPGWRKTYVELLDANAPALLVALSEGGGTTSLASVESTAWAQVAGAYGYRSDDDDERRHVASFVRIMVNELANLGSVVTEAGEVSLTGLGRALAAGLGLAAQEAEADIDLDLDDLDLVDTDAESLLLVCLEEMEPPEATQHLRAWCNAQGADDAAGQLCEAMLDNDEPEFWSLGFEALDMVDPMVAEPAVRRLQEDLRLRRLATDWLSRGSHSRQ